MISCLSRGDLHGPVRRMGLYCTKGPGAPASQHLFFWHSGLDPGGCFSPPIRLPNPYPSSPCPQQPSVSCHGGLFWTLRSSSGYPRGTYELINFPQNSGDLSAVIYYRRWVGIPSFRQRRSDRIYLSLGHQFQPLLPLTGGAISRDHYFTVDHFLKQANACLLTCAHIENSSF